MELEDGRGTAGFLTLASLFSFSTPPYIRKYSWFVQFSLEQLLSSSLDKRSSKHEKEASMNSVSSVDAEAKLKGKLMYRYMKITHNSTQK